MTDRRARRFRASPRPRLLALAVRAGLAGLPALAILIPLLPAAHAAETIASRSYDIPSGPLASTLLQFAQQSGIQLSVDAGLTGKLHSPGVSGRHSVNSAFLALLAGTGLEAVSRGGNEYTLRKLPTPQKDSTAAPAISTLAPVLVKAGAEVESAWGPVKGYTAKRSATATKTDTPIIETPQSISIVAQEEIEVRQASSLREALGYVSGITAFEGSNHTGDELVIRGFQAGGTNGSLYRDGSKFAVNAYDNQQEPYGLERIELLKGASSVLYGAAAPGGIINTVTKRPSADPLHELNVQLGNANRKQISGDFGGALSDDGVWSYRLTALQRNSGTFVDHVPDDRSYLAPALKWQPDADTSLVLLAQYQKDRTAYIYALPAEGTILDNPNGRIARNRFQGEPGYDKYESTIWSLGYLFEHRLSDALRLRHSLRYFDIAQSVPMVWSSGLDSTLRNTLRGAQDREDSSDALTSDTSLEYKWQTGIAEHTTLVGIDFTAQSHRTVRYGRSAAPLDLYAPIYGSPLGAPSPNDYSGTDKGQRLGLYAQNQTKLAGKWVALLGARQDWSRSSYAPYFSDSGTERQNDRATTARAGLVYLADNGLAPFISLSQSFEPEIGRDRSGKQFEPTRGEQLEIGVRYQPSGQQTLLSATVYQLTRTNVSVSDPVDSNYSVQMGKVRSRGLELEARTQIGRHLNVIGAYSYTDARTLESSPLYPEESGKRSGGVPYNQFSLWSDYDFGLFGLAGLKIGVGVRHVDPTKGVWIDGTVPAVTLVDAMVGYVTGSWRYALNATNLTDRTYVSSCTYGCFYGEARKLTATVSYRW